ncbi:MAG: hypothetical protein CMI18_01340 [Opitutaceae bacterium]|nr:hypothetical protein [Opitutaceae bacterium]
MNVCVKKQFGRICLAFLVLISAGLPSLLASSSDSESDDGSYWFYQPISNVKDGIQVKTAIDKFQWRPH